MVTVRDDCVSRCLDQMGQGARPTQTEHPSKNSIDNEHFQCHYHYSPSKRMTTDTTPLSAPDNPEQSTTITTAITTVTADSIATVSADAIAIATDHCNATATTDSELNNSTTISIDLHKAPSVTDEATTMEPVEEPVMSIAVASTDRTTVLQTSPPSSLSSMHSTTSTSTQPLLPATVNALAPPTVTDMNATNTAIATATTTIPSTLAAVRPSFQSYNINNKRPSMHRPSTVKTKRPRVSPPAIATPTRPSAIPLADPHVVTMVHDMMGLMQLYGPLTVAQLEYNLPRPCSKHTVTDTLQILVTTGMVQVVLDSQPTQYCMFHGIPRPDVILPSHILGELESTFQQTTKSEQRIAKLKDALLAGTSAKEVLTDILKDHPDIVKDPVYLAALQNVHITIDANLFHHSKI